MSDPRQSEQILDCIRETLGVEVTLESTLDPWDSLTILLVVVDLEERLGLRLASEESAASMVTVADLLGALYTAD